MSKKEIQGMQDINDIKRTRRRRRRQRNHFLAVMTVVLFMGMIAGLGGFGYMKIAEWQKAKAHEDEVADKLDELKENEIAQIPTISEPESAIDVPMVNPLEESLKEKISQMTTEQKVAGLFFVTPESLTDVDVAVQAGNSTKEALEKFQVGGIVYFKKNIQSETQLKEMLLNTKSYSANRVFLGVNEEGGSVSSVASKLKVAKVDTAEKLGQKETTDSTYETGKIIGAYLKDLGFNVNFAPVADVKTDSKNKLLGDRSFGSDAQSVANHVTAMAQGMEENGISACIKEFPGVLGSANKDTEDGMSVTERTLIEMRNTEFLSFKAAIESKTDFIMVSNVSAPNLTGGEYIPCCLSEDVVTDILREELGYEGIIVTAPLNQTAVTEYYTSGDAAIMALEAGADMIMMPDNFQEAYYAVLAAVLNGSLSEERVEESLLRIYKVKYADLVIE